MKAALRQNRFAGNAPPALTGEATRRTKFACVAQRFRGGLYSSAPRSQAAWNRAIRGSGAAP